MKRKLVLTPFDHGVFFSIHQILNEKLSSKQEYPVDIQHLLFSSVIMCGVDEIHSMGEPMYTNSTLVTKTLSTKSTELYIDCVDKIDSIFKNYRVCEKNSESFFKYMIAALLYCMQSNSVPLISGNLEVELKKTHLPSELSIPIQILTSSIEYKSAELPIIRGDLNKMNIQKLLDVYQSKHFLNYKESQADIENSTKLSSATIKKIEKAGKELTRRNSGLLFLKENIINAVPVTAKLIDLFFGKLPGIVSKYASDIAVGYLKDYKSIPIYNCESLLSNEIDKQLQLYLDEQISIPLNRDSKLHSDNT